MLNLAISTTKVLFFLHSTKYFDIKTLKPHFYPQESAKVLLFTDIRKFLCFCANFLMEENADNPTFQIVEHKLHELHEFLFLNTD